MIYFVLAIVILVAVAALFLFLDLMRAALSNRVRVGTMALFFRSVVIAALVTIAVWLFPIAVVGGVFR